MRKRDSNTSGSSDVDAGTLALGVSIDVSQPSCVNIRLGLSINLSLLQRQPSTPAASSIAYSDTASWVGTFVEPVGSTQPLPSTATAIHFLCRCLMMTFLGTLSNKQTCMFNKNVLNHTNGKT